MIKSFVYIVGIFAIGYSDLSHSSLLFSLLLPLFIPIFCIFLFLELVVYLTPFGSTSEYSIYDLLYDFFDFRAEVEAVGFWNAAYLFLIAILEPTLLVASLFMLINAIQL